MQQKVLARLPSLQSENPKSKIQNLKLVAVVAIVVTLAIGVAAAQAQQPTKIPRIGFLANTGPQDVTIEPFRQALGDLGYNEGKNILVEYRYYEAKRERIPSLVAELVQLRVNALIAGAPPVIRAAKQATKTIPIIMVTNQDPVTAGYVDSLARPGGNITGLTNLTRDLSEKRLELVKEVIPSISRVGLIWNADGLDAGFGNAFKRYEAAARALKITIESLAVRGSKPDLDGAFRIAAKERIRALITVTHIVINPYQKQIADLAIKRRLPSMGERIEYIEAGGLISYAADDLNSYRRAAWYVDKILKGAKPADLPVEQPTKFDLSINLKTAKQIDLTIPPNVLARADKVIR